MMRARVSLRASALLVGALALGLMAQSETHSVPDRLVKEASAVKDRHIDSLFKLPAVDGARVGVSKKHPGKAVIQIYITRALTRKERRSFPKVLEGIPVEIQKTGPIRALPAGAGVKGVEASAAGADRKSPEKAEDRPQKARP